MKCKMFWIVQVDFKKVYFVCIWYLVSSKGSVTYSEVRALPHKQPTVTDMYNSITTSMNTTISLSGKHLIFARKVFTNKFQPM